MRVNPFVLIFLVMSLSPKVGLCGDPEETPATEVKDSAIEKKITWGKETDGLVANLRALTPTVKPGEPMVFEILVKNVSKEEIRLLGHKNPSPSTWVFNFGQWVWLSPQPSLPSVPLKPGDTASVRCLVATTRDSMTAEHKSRFLDNRWGAVFAPFRNVKSKKESLRLPEGVYRVRASSPFISAHRKAAIETNTIEVRIIGRR